MRFYNDLNRTYALQHHHQQYHGDGNADDHGDGIDGTGKAYVAVHFSGEAGVGSSNGCYGQNHQSLPHLQGEGEHKIERTGKDGGKAT